MQYNVFNITMKHTWLRIFFVYCLESPKLSVDNKTDVKLMMMMMMSHGKTCEEIAVFYF